MHGNPDTTRLDRVDALLRAASAFDRRAPACARFRLSISAALDGELSELEWRRVEAHVAHCGLCRAFLEEVWSMSAEIAAAATTR